MSDTIYRQEVDVLVDELARVLSDRRDGLQRGRHYTKILEDILHLPSAQPERLTDDDFETIRIHLNAYKEKLFNQNRRKEAEEYQRIIDRFMAFASAQPEYFDYTDIDEAWEYYAKEQDANLTDNAKQIKEAMWVGYRIGLKSAHPNTDEWCHDCKEYDQEKHCCPRWNRVIRKTLKDARPEIIQCIDCVFSVEIEDDYRMICYNRNGLDSRVFRDDFCSYAERRTDD